MRSLVVLLVLILALSVRAQIPAAAEADFVVKDFHFRSGEVSWAAVWERELREFLATNAP